MFVLGLTGSIGMGKSTTAAMFRHEGIPVFDADGAVHDLYRGAAVPLVEAAFPGTVRDGAIDRGRLADRVLNDPEALKRLENIVHPLVRRARESFLRQAEAEGVPLVVLDVPLLFETGGDAQVDAVAVVSASESVQNARVMARAGMTAARLSAIKAKQVPDEEKRRRAQFTIDTGSGLEAARAQVRTLIATLTAPDPKNGP